MNRCIFIRYENMNDKNHKKQKKEDTSLPEIKVKKDKRLTAMEEKDAKELALAIRDLMRQGKDGK